MSAPFRIGIAGIGGVGGFYAAMLSRHYFHNRGYEITCITRNKSLEVITENGLTLHFGEETIHATPHVVTDKPVGIFDLLLLCCKSYHLDQVMEQLAPHIGPQTLLLPLQNGVESAQQVAARFPDAQVLNGCVYIVSKRTAPAEIRVKGNFNRLLFGKAGLDAGTAAMLTQLFEATGVKTEYYDDIADKAWEKFTFISPVATYTTAYNMTLGEICSSPEDLARFTALMHEVIAVGRAAGQQLDATLFEKNMQIVRSLPKDTTSSMHADFVAGRQTEADTLTRYVTLRATDLHVEAPVYREVANRLYYQLYK
jgi:2-dehydropantoate 2-reductase